jgi:hypothetical protein
LGSNAAGRGKGEVTLARAASSSLAARAVARGKPANSMAITAASAARMICLQTLAAFVPGISASPCRYH